MQMHWCTATVDLAGKNLTHFHFHQFEPVSWPEVQVLMSLHGGEESVFDVKPITISETSPQAEKERLALKYTWAAVERVFPGRIPRMEALMPGERTDQPLADNYGLPIAIAGNGHPIREPSDNPPPPPQPIPPQPDDDEEEDAAGAGSPPPTAVFKPGKHPRPAKGA